MAIVIRDVNEMYDRSVYDMETLEAIMDFGRKTSMISPEKFDDIDIWFVIYSAYAHDLYTVVDKLRDQKKAPYDIPDIMAATTMIMAAELNRADSEEKIEREIIIKKLTGALFFVIYSHMINAGEACFVACHEKEIGIVVRNNDDIDDLYIIDVYGLAKKIIDEAFIDSSSQGCFGLLINPERAEQLIMEEISAHKKVELAPHEE